MDSLITRSTYYYLIFLEKISEWSVTKDRNDFLETSYPGKHWPKGYYRCFKWKLKYYLIEWYIYFLVEYWFTKIEFPKKIPEFVYRPLWNFFLECDDSNRAIASFVIRNKDVIGNFNQNGSKIPNKLLEISIDRCKLFFKPFCNKNQWLKLDLFQNWWVQLRTLTQPNNAPD